MREKRLYRCFGTARQPVVGCALLLAAIAPALAAPACSALATDPAYGVGGNPDIKSASSAIVPATATNVSYCEVTLLYGTKPTQNINIVVGLPLSAADGGSGGIQGAWNGRTQGLGGSGCTGNLDPTLAVNTGYVGSGNDLGHSGGDCTPGVNPDGTYNLQFIEDFIRNGIKQQVLWSKQLARRYYVMEPAYNYWNSCSTGGRQGYLLAQELGTELEGILADAPAIYWTRFQTAQMWGEIAMLDETGGPISLAKLAQAQASAVAACDADDGIVDGIIADPRSCYFSARANVCGTATAPSSNCLTSAEADAIDKIWEGPRNLRDNRIWYGLDRGSDFFILDAPTPFFLGVIQFEWDEHNQSFNWQTVDLSEYPQVAQDGSRNIADVTDTFGPLDTFRDYGGKLMTWVGSNDQFIYPRGVLNYYRQMASRYSDNDQPDYPRLQHFYRLFRAPGVGHCGFNSAGPVPVNAFGALVDWVENGVAPDFLLASGGYAAPATGRTRPVCKYPQTAIYNGSGSTDDAANFHCGRDVEKPALVCPDVLARYKDERDGPLDCSGTGVTAQECRDLNKHSP